MADNLVTGIIERHRPAPPSAKAPKSGRESSSSSCLFLLLTSFAIPVSSFRSPCPLHRRLNLVDRPWRTTPIEYYSPNTALSIAGSDYVSNLLYQEQENIIVRRGELEEGFVTNATPLLAPAIKVRGTGKAGGFGNAASGGGGSGRSTASSSKAEGKEHAKVLTKEGVLRIDGVLSPDTADSVRDHLYDLRRISEAEVSEGKIQPIQRFAQVLLKRNRCDLTIPLGGGSNDIITKALEEALCKSPVGSTISSIFGDGAILHELSCLMSDPGSQRQVIHPDTPHVEGRGPALFTCFVALQDVTVEMGPTTWLPRTHNKESHERFKDSSSSGGGGGDGGDSPKDDLIKTQPAVLGLLPKGSCVVFDSRVLHCGTANLSSKSRALFYFSFKDPQVGYPGNPASIRQELASANVSLGALIEDLTSFGKGKGSPLIDRLGSQMR
jgi:ectoine hydroxylase-related dioxygenase (phytanoyl-CoA dioxygenase family)